MRALVAHVLMGFAFAGLATAMDAKAQWTPERTVEIIVGTSAGGAQDRGARVIQKIMQDQKLIPVSSVVVNKAGGGGAIGWGYQNQRAGDPHYLSISSVPLLTNQITGGSTISYRDYSPIALMFDEHIAFVVRPESQFTNARDLVAALRKDPGSLSIGLATALGGSNHIALGLAMKAAGVDARRLKVVVFNSAGDSVIAVLGGHVDMTVASAANVANHIRGGKLRGLAVPTASRLGEELASVPTWKEQGVDVVFATWRGVLGPKALASQQVSYWEQVMARVARSPEWMEQVEKNQWGAHYLNSADSKTFMDAQYDILRNLLQELGLAK